MIGIQTFIGRRSTLIPWQGDYSAQKRSLIETTLADAALMRRFRAGEPLPAGYGARIDERVVEYPWVFAHLDAGAELVLDAGSTFSKDFLLDGILKDRRIVIYTLDTDWITLNPLVSYVFGDFRNMLLRDACVDAICCISTLEHVGMGQDYKTYSAHHLPPDQDLFGYREALREFNRILKPGGQFLLTVPFGRRENHGWLQQFDAEALADVVRFCPGEFKQSAYYLYRLDGWQVAAATECADARYFNIHAESGFDPDYAAAARSVACLEFRKPAGSAD